MYYWSRWTNIATEESRAGETRIMHSSWRDTDRQTALRETRPVVVVARSRTQALSTSFAPQRSRCQERGTSSRISLDVRRSRSYTTTSATRSHTSASWQPEATTQPVLTE